MDKWTYTIVGGYTIVCRIKFYLYRKFFLEWEGDLGFFFMKRDQREKKVLLQDM
jgi:hypothetical protein